MRRGRYGRLLRTGVRARLSDESRHTGDEVVEGSRGAGKESTGEVSINPSCCYPYKLSKDRPWYPRYTSLHGN